MRITVLTEPEIRQCAPLDLETVAEVEGAFTALAEGRAVAPIMSIPVAEHRGEMHVKSAVVQGADSFAVKIASGFLDNAKLGLPYASGLILLFSAKTGFPEAIFLDNGYLTHARTAAAGAIAAKYLAPDTPGTVGIVGAGRQGRFQLRALKLVRDFDRVLVYDQNQPLATEFAATMSAEMGVPVEAMNDPAPLVRESCIVVTATPSHTPIVRAEWLHPGLHITAMGSDNEQKQELFPEVLARSDRLVCDLRTQAFGLGEHRAALEAGLLTADASVDELGEITAGRKPGRTSPDEITVCDLTGVGTQDTAIALLTYRRATEMGLGRFIDS